MKSELRQQARTLANELDWLHAKTPVFNQIKRVQDHDSIDRVVKLLYDLSRNRPSKRAV